MLRKNLKHMFMCFFGSRDRRDRGVQSIHFCWCFVAANGYTDPSHTPKQTTQLLQKKQKTNVINLKMQKQHLALGPKSQSRHFLAFSAPSSSQGSGRKEGMRLGSFNFWTKFTNSSTSAEKTTERCSRMNPGGFSPTKVEGLHDQPSYFIGIWWDTMECN